VSGNARTAGKARIATVTALAITRIRLALMGHLPVKLAIGLRNLAKGPDFSKQSSDYRATAILDELPTIKFRLSAALSVARKPLVRRPRLVASNRLGSRICAGQADERPKTMGRPTIWRREPRRFRHLRSRKSSSFARGTEGSNPAPSSGESSELRWSPDGSKLAFVSRRGDHAFVGVYDSAAKSLVYLDPSVDSDQEPAWSPDSRQIAFLRIPASKSRLPFSPRRDGQPWSIRIAEAMTGKGREIWRAETGQGSAFHEVVAGNQLLWGARGQLVFPWESDGWAHLYSVTASGGTAKLLTPGNFEVEYVAMSANREEIIFSSNQDDIDRRHVWRISPSGDRPGAVTTGSGIETAPVMASDNRTVLVLHSDAQTPMRPAVLAGKGELRDLAPETVPSDFPSRALVTSQQVIFSAADGMQIHGQLFLPSTGGDAARHPAIVFFHGGSRRQMLLGWHYMFYYSNAYALNQYLASRGYVVLSVNYRSGIGYGLDFREALNYGAMGASEFNDVEGAGVYLRTRTDVDPHRIGLWGGSYGGYLTALGLARASDLFAAGVDIHGVHDWNTEIPNFKASYKPNERPDAARLAWESSPLASISTWRSPVLLIQGDDDRNVPFVEMVDLAEALRKQGVSFDQLVFPDEIHDFLLHRTWLAAYHAASDFFDRHFRTPGK